MFCFAMFVHAPGPLKYYNISATNIMRDLVYRHLIIYIILYYIIYIIF